MRKRCEACQDEWWQRWSNWIAWLGASLHIAGCDHMERPGKRRRRRGVHPEPQPGRRQHQLLDGGALRAARPWQAAVPRVRRRLFQHIRGSRLYHKPIHAPTLPQGIDCQETSLYFHRY